jgi:hypothetical protein
VRQRTELLRIALPRSYLLLHQSVALACRFFQLSPVNDLYVSAGVGDDSSSLQYPRCDRHAGAASPQHLGQKFLRQWKRVRPYAVRAHQQPSRQSLIHLMQPIAGGNLRDLHSHDLRKLLELALQSGALAKQ